MTGRTVVKHESRFDDHERARLLAYLEYEAQTCPGCGVHPDIVDADDLNLSPGAKYCAGCKVTAQFQRVLADADEKTERSLEGKPPATERPSDGRRVALLLTERDPRQQPPTPAKER